MKPTRISVIFVILITILASIFSSAVTLKVLFPKLLSQYENSDNSSVQPVISPIPEGSSDWLKQMESGVKAIAKNLRSSVVNVIINKDIQLYRTDPFWFFYEPSGTVRKQVGGGTWFFITKDGLILTNKHVVSEPDATYTIITGENEEFVGKVVAVDPLTDLAIVRAVTKDGKNLTDRTPVEFISDSKAVDVGTFVIAMWNALAQFQNTLTFWIVSGIGRSIQAGNQAWGNVEQLSWLLQTDAAINPGNSGWPLVNLDGKVVGINTAVAAWANGLGFAIPLSSKDIKYILTSLTKYNTIKRPFLGVQYSPIDKNVAKTNNLASDSWDVIIPNGIVAGSPAEKAGLKSGDIIKEVDGKTLKDWVDLRDALSDKFPGDTIKLKILSGSGSEKSLELQLGSI